MDILTNLQNSLNDFLNAGIFKHVLFGLALLPAYPIVRALWFNHIVSRKIDKDIEDQRHSRCA